MPNSAPSYSVYPTVYGTAHHEGGQGFRDPWESFRGDQGFCGRGQPNGGRGGGFRGRGQPNEGCGGGFCGRGQPNGGRGGGFCGRGQPNEGCGGGFRGRGQPNGGRGGGFRGRGQPNGGRGGGFRGRGRDADGHGQRSSGTGNYARRRNGFPSADKDFESLKCRETSYANVKQPPLFGEVNQVTDESERVNEIDVEKALKIVEENDVTFVTAKTGVGKSTTLPHAIFQKYPNSIMIITVPRRISAIQISARVAELLNSEVGELVGYSVRGDTRGCIGVTPIMFVTSYSLLLYLFQFPPGEIQLDHVILDEFHERSSDVQMSSLLIRSLIRKSKVKPTFKLILSSAVDVSSHWIDYFSNSGLKVGVFCDEAYRFEVKEVFFDEIADRCSVPANDLVNGELVLPSQNEVLTLRLYKILEMFSQEIDQPQQSVLVFLPGRQEIERIARWIEMEYPMKFRVVIWQREVDLSEIEQEIKKDYFPKVKVYLATDIAEVSLTLPDVIAVVDCCINKRKHQCYDSSSPLAFPTLQLMWCSKSNLDQRRGRVGRVRKGFYYNLLSKHDVDKLVDISNRGHTFDDISTITMHSLFLTSRPIELISRWCEPPDQRLMEFCIDHLANEGFIAKVANEESEIVETSKDIKFLGKWKKSWKALLDVREPEGIVSVPKTHWSLTLKGFITAHIPGQYESNEIGFWGAIMGCPRAALLVASSATALFPFTVPFDTDFEAREKHVQIVSAMMKDRMEKLLGNTQLIQNDLLVVGHATFEMYQNNIAEDEEEFKKWCDKNSLNADRIKDAACTYDLSTERLKELVYLGPEMESDELKSWGIILHIITIAAYALHAVQVFSRRMPFKGRGCILDLHCNCGAGFPTTANWRYGNVVIPVSLLPGKKGFVGGCAIECSVSQYNLVLLLLSSSLKFAVFDSDYYFVLDKYYSSGKSKRFFFCCHSFIGKQILSLRMMLAVRIASVSDWIRRGVATGENSYELFESKNFSMVPQSFRENSTQNQKQLVEIIQLLFTDPSLKITKANEKELPSVEWHDSLLNL